MSNAARLDTRTCSVFGSILMYNKFVVERRTVESTSSVINRKPNSAFRELGTLYVFKRMFVFIQLVLTCKARKTKTKLELEAVIILIFFAKTINVVSFDYRTCRHLAYYLCRQRTVPKFQEFLIKI